MGQSFSSSTRPHPEAKKSSEVEEVILFGSRVPLGLLPHRDQWAASDHREPVWEALGCAGSDWWSRWMIIPSACEIGGDQEHRLFEDCTPTTSTGGDLTTSIAMPREYGLEK